MIFLYLKWILQNIKCIPNQLFNAGNLFSKNLIYDDSYHGCASTNYVFIKIFMSQITNLWMLLHYINLVSFVLYNMYYVLIVLSHVNSIITPEPRPLKKGTFDSNAAINSEGSGDMSLTQYNQIWSSANSFFRNRQEFTCFLEH